MAASWEWKQDDQIVPGLMALRRLGGGHRYEAYLAWDETLFAPVVAKVLRPDQVDDPGALRSLTAEARMLDRLAHPVLVRSFAAVLDGPRPHLLLEHLDGPRLSSLLRRHGPLALEQILPLGLEVCSALHYLAASGVVHLDVKPSNIIMGSPPRLIDLSIARTIDSAARLDHAVGTDGYMAPEQCDPPRSGTPGPPADIWGMGATMFEALCGMRPFADGEASDDAAPERRWPQLVDEPASLPSNSPPVVRDLVMACLDGDPSARPTAAELARALEPLVDSLPAPMLGRFRPGPRVA